MPVIDENPYKDPGAAVTPGPNGIGCMRIWPTIVIAGLLFLVAAQRIWMPFAFAILVVSIQMMMLLFAWLFRRKREHAMRLRLVRFGIYGLTLFAALGVATVEERFIKAQADELVAACEGFERDRGRLPNELSELVPDYRPSVPTALGHVFFLYGAFYSYRPPTETSSAVFFYQLNPDASRRYSFATHQWNPP